MRFLDRKNELSPVASASVSWTGRASADLGHPAPRGRLTLARLPASGPVPTDRPLPQPSSLCCAAALGDHRAEERENC